LSGKKFGALRLPPDAPACLLTHHGITCHRVGRYGYRHFMQAQDF